MTPAEEMLRTAKTIAVVGLSPNPLRPSHAVAEYLQAQGYRIIPVNPKHTEVLGEMSYPRLEDVPEKIDVVNVFRRPEYTPGVVEAAIGVGAKGVWLQQGIVNAEARRLAEEAGLHYVEDRCMLVEHRRLMR